MQNYVLLETNNTLQGDLRRDDTGWYHLLPDSIDRQMGIRQMGIRTFMMYYSIIHTIETVRLQSYPTSMISIYDVHFHRIYDV